MKKTVETIIQFVSDNWLVLFLVLTIVAVTMFVLIAINCIRTIRDSVVIPNMKAQAENDYYLKSQNVTNKEVDDVERSEPSNSFDDLFD